MQNYRFEVQITDEGKVYVRHNCTSLVEFLGVLEVIKAVGLKMFESSQKAAQQAQEKGIDPHEYLRKVQQETKFLNVAGIKGLFRDD